MTSLTIVIPSYNSEKTLERAVRGLDEFSDKLEVIIVNDGSKDKTEEIASSLVERYPFIKLINQENKGHGGAINTGLCHASGTWFKVLDSDDRLEVNGLREFFNIIEKKQDIADQCDMIMMDFVYEFLQDKNISNRARAKKKFYIDEDGARYKLLNKTYKDIFVPETIVEWNKIENIKPKLILMHALIYRTSFLKEIGIVLPEHVSYEDNLFVAIPQVSLKRFYYTPQILYRYFIGRDEQSVSLKSILRNKDKQNIVTKEYFRQIEIKYNQSSGLRTYLIDHGTRLVIMSYIAMAMIDGPTSLNKFNDELNSENPKLWSEVSKDIRYRIVRSISRLGCKFNSFLYKNVFKLLGFS